MLVEIENADILQSALFTSGVFPMLLEVRQAYPELTTFRGKSTGRTVLDSSTVTQVHNSGYKTVVDLTYEEFRWAYAESVKSGEPFLDLKASNLGNIKAAYRRHGGPRHDPSPFRLG